MLADMAIHLGLPTFLAGFVVSAIIIALRSSRHDPARILRGISVEHHPLVAGLFVLVEALARTGVIKPGGGARRTHAARRLGPVSLQASRPRSPRPSRTICRSVLLQAARSTTRMRRTPYRVPPNRRRFRAESFGDRIVRDDLMAHSSAPRRPQRHALRQFLKTGTRAMFPALRLVANSVAARIRLSLNLASRRILIRRLFDNTVGVGTRFHPRRRRLARRVARSQHPHRQ